MRNAGIPCLSFTTCVPVSLTTLKATVADKDRGRVEEVHMCLELFKALNKHVGPAQLLWKKRNVILTGR